MWQILENILTCSILDTVCDSFLLRIGFRKERNDENYLPFADFETSCRRVYLQSMELVRFRSILLIYKVLSEDDNFVSKPIKTVGHGGPSRLYLKFLGKLDRAVMDKFRMAERRP